MPVMDALHLKNMLREDLDGDFYKSFLKNFMESFTKQNSYAPPSRNKLASPTGEQVRQAMKAALDVGECFYVDPKMHTLITAASESMPSEPLSRHDLPSTHGFLLIPGGIGTIDIRGRLLKTNAIVWSDDGSDVTLFLLTDKNDPEDMGNHEAGLPPDLPRLTLNHLSAMRVGGELPLSVTGNFIIPPEVPISVMTSPDGTQTGFHIPEGFSPEELEKKFSVSPDLLCRWLLTTWRLMQQRITDVRDEVPPRQARRAYERKNLATKVTVIELRAHESKGDGSTDVEWSHRWLVRGHWRNQAVKDENGEWTHRLIYIHPHIRGPEHLPLLIRQHVYSLTR